MREKPKSKSVSDKKKLSIKRSAERVALHRQKAKEQKSKGGSGGGK